MTTVLEKPKISALNSPQRSFFLETLDADLVHCQLSDAYTGLLLINLSGVALVNQEMGYSFGDGLIAGVASYISEIVRPDDFLMRIDGVIFALIMPGLSSEGQVMLAARKVASVCMDGVVVNGQKISVRPHIGAAFAPEHGRTAETLLRCADIALGEAKRKKSEISLYEPEPAGKDQNRLALQSDLEIAIKNNELEVYFQPKIDLHTGQIYGVETLSRWRHPSRGFVSPDLFVDIAERSGLIEPLTQWNLNAALNNQQKHFPELSVAVNLSATLLHHNDIAELIEQAIAIWGISSEQLVLEVTESAIIIDPIKSFAILHRLHSQGIRLSIDDFGTGYSSLAYLSELPVHELKIDKSFVVDMSKNRQNAKIVQAVIALAHNLELSVVAEGVEDEQTLDILRDMGCDIAQGYFFGRPLPIDDLVSWLKDSDWRRKDA